MSNPAASSTRHLQAIAQALLVCFLWSTSWVFIKFGLQSNLPALTFAGLRYSLAFFCLLPFVLVNPTHRATLRNISHATWLQLILLGLVFYTLAQGAQFVGLAFLPTATLSLLLNLTPVSVALLSSFLSKESPTPAQWFGIALSTAGVLVYFWPVVLPEGQLIGLLAGVIGVLSNATASLMGRRVNQHSGLSPLIVTTLSMGIGGLALLGAGGLSQGFVALDLSQWLIIAWLAVVNTAAAFTLWNNSLRTLTAVESSILNSTMLPQIAVLAWLFLEEPLTLKQIIGMVLVGIGTLLVQLWRHWPGAVKATTQASD